MRSGGQPGSTLWALIQFVMESHYFMKWLFSPTPGAFMDFRDKVTTFWRERASVAAISRNSKPSLSKFGEDVVLQILLQPGRQGTYVDVVPITKPTGLILFAFISGAGVDWL
jgi:hypothetical protein